MNDEVRELRKIITALESVCVYVRDDRESGVPGYMKEAIHQALKQAEAAPELLDKMEGRKEEEEPGPARKFLGLAEYRIINYIAHVMPIPGFLAKSEDTMKNKKL